MYDSGIIYLMRHCSTPNDELNYPKLVGQKRLQHWCGNCMPDYYLSEAGTQHAKMLADYFANKDITAVYSSTLPEAVETAAWIGNQIDNLGVLAYDSALQEADMGEWDGLEWDEIKRDDYERYGSFLRDPGTYGFPNGETYSELCRRGLAFVEKVSREHAGERILLVSHSELNRAVLAALCQLPLQRVREIDQDPGGINLIRVFRGHMELQAVNYTNEFELAELEEEDDETCIHPTV